MKGRDGRKGNEEEEGKKDAPQVLDLDCGCVYAPFRTTAYSTGAEMVSNSLIVYFAGESRCMCSLYCTFCNNLLGTKLTSPIMADPGE